MQKTFIGLITLAAGTGICGLPAVWHRQEQQQRTILLHLRTEPTRKASAMAQALTLEKAVRQYIHVIHGTPPAVNWEQALQPYLPSGFSFSIPALLGEEPRRFALNRAIADRNINMLDFNRDLTLFFESSSQDLSACDNLESLPAEDGASGWTAIYLSQQKPVAVYVSTGSRSTIVRNAAIGDYPSMTK